MLSLGVGFQRRTAWTALYLLISKSRNGMMQSNTRSVSPTKGITGQMKRGELRRGKVKTSSLIPLFHKNIGLSRAAVVLVELARSATLQQMQRQKPQLMLSRRRWVVTVRDENTDRKSVATGNPIKPIRGRTFHHYRVRNGTSQRFHMKRRVRT